ncbi:hypothetical protein ELY21_12030 [Legionella sp. km535]|uniref:hypothetical protein n=1 Tax=Legionella sp. km535 TaxID=2498107 RepID=UPI000FA6E2D0|nr:hypothetical protein [Legionella sp. km535]RUR16975.1 hypothetical protein ELY21_12030 [Legionella sp. km535]
MTIKNSLDQHQQLLQICSNYKTHLVSQSNLAEPVIKRKLEIIDSLLESLGDNLYSMKNQERSQFVEQFKSKFFTVKDELSQHRDPCSIQFLKNIGYALSILLCGSGLLFSLMTKNSLAFWKSHGQITSDQVSQTLSVKIDDSELDPNQEYTVQPGWNS